MCDVENDYETTVKVVDYTEEFKRTYRRFAPLTLAVQGKGSNVLILTELDQDLKRFDGKKAKYQLEHRWLSMECNDERDQAFCCASGADFTFWQKKEIAGLLKNIDAGKANLFDHFNLF